MSRWGVSDRVTKSQIRRIGTKIKETKVESMVTTTVRVIMSEIETTTTTSTGVTMVREMIEMGPTSLIKNCEVTPTDDGDSVAGVEDMLHKIIKRFDASDEHIK